MLLLVEGRRRRRRRRRGGRRRQARLGCPLRGKEPYFAATDECRAVSEQDFSDWKPRRSWRPQQPLKCLAARETGSRSLVRLRHCAPQCVRGDTNLPVATTFAPSCETST